MKQRFRSFGYAIQGIGQATKQPNMVIHLIVAVIVILTGLFFELSRTDWALVIFAMGLVLAAECINTSIEKLTDMVSPDHNKIAGQVKDIAAGAVLLCAVTAIIIGLIVFIPEIYSQFE